MSFDQTTSGVTDMLVSYNGTTLQAAPYTGTTGTFGAVPGTPTLTDTGAETLEAVQYGNKYYAFLSSNRTQRLGFSNVGGIVVPSCTIDGTKLLVTTTSILPPNPFSLVTVGQSVTGTRIDTNTVVIANDGVTITLSKLALTAGTDTLTFGGNFVFNARPSFLNPVASIETKITGVATGTHTWNATTPDFGVGYYWYFYTEVYCPGVQDDIEYLESAFSGKPDWFQITNVSTQSAIITRNSVLANTVALGSVYPTHWQVYMSTVQSNTTTVPALNTFRRQGGLITMAIDPTTNKTVELTESQGVTAWYFPTAYSALDTPTGYTAWSSPSSIGAIDGTFATSVAVNTGQLLKTFNIPNIATTTVTGIEMNLRASANSNLLQIVVEPRIYSGANVSVQGRKFIPLNYSTLTDVVVGSPSDIWGMSTAPTMTLLNTVDVFKVAIYHTSGVGVGLDGIRFRFYYTGAAINSNGRRYRTVSYSSQEGVTIVDDAALPGPISTTGDVFEGSLVVDDVTDPSAIAYSLPSYPEYFPRPYRVRFNSRKKDKVKLIRRLGQVLIVGMLSGIKRVNYLPRETDTNFNSSQGEVAEDIAADHGVVGPMAGTLFDIPGSGTVLAYVSHKGIHYTDGITSKFLNVDLDWANTVNLNNIGTCILRNYSALSWLVLYYNPAGSLNARNTKALIFHYSPEKIKQGGYLPCTGPISVSARSAVEANLNGVPKLLTGHESISAVFLEDSGLTIPNGYTVSDMTAEPTGQDVVKIIPKICTRRQYAAGLENGMRTERSFIQCTAYGINYGPYVCNTTASVINSGTVQTPSTLFGSVVPGMIASGDNILPGSIVTASVPGSVTISPPPGGVGAGTVTFSTGAFNVTVRGQNILEPLTTFQTVYTSSQVGGLVDVHPDNRAQAIEYVIEKVKAPNGTYYDLGTNLRLHYMGQLASHGGLNTNQGTL
jgi:hypothetical protein